MSAKLGESGIGKLKRLHGDNMQGIEPPQREASLAMQAFTPPPASKASSPTAKAPSNAHAKALVFTSKLAWTTGKLTTPWDKHRVSACRPRLHPTPTHSLDDSSHTGQGYSHSLRKNEKFPTHRLGNARSRRQVALFSPDSPRWYLPRT